MRGQRMNTARAAGDTPDADNLRTLNIVGCGRAGRTLGRLWAERSVFRIGDVLNRSGASADDAVTFMGAGRRIEETAQMRPADLYMIGTPDDQLVNAGRALATTGLLASGTIVFHLSGATRTEVLAPVRVAGALAASVHPVKSFADPAVSVHSFDGTFCGVEGDPEAVEVLSRGFESIGGRMFAIDPEHKEIYHAASVFSCNYVTALLEVGIQAYVKAGIPRATAFEIVAPILRETVDNVVSMDTVDALTGPIARGDHGTVARQLDALASWNREYCDLYRRLGSVALRLSGLQGTASRESIGVLSDLLAADDADRS